MISLLARQIGGDKLLVCRLAVSLDSSESS